MTIYTVCGATGYLAHMALATVNVGVNAVFTGFSWAVASSLSSALIGPRLAYVHVAWGMGLAEAELLAEPDPEPEPLEEEMAEAQGDQLRWMRGWGLKQWGGVTLLFLVLGRGAVTPLLRLGGGDRGGGGGGSHLCGGGGGGGSYITDGSTALTFRTAAPQVVPAPKLSFR